MLLLSDGEKVSASNEVPYALVLSLTILLFAIVTAI
jgi:hypothetical protein